LNFLADGPATQKEIVEALGLRQGHVSNYIKKLSAARLLKRGPPVELIDQGAGLF
jgi:DNA-binding MarR family transcriptional regulator